MRPRRAGCLVLVAAAALAVLLLRPESPPHPSESWLGAVGVTPAFEQVDGLRLRYVRKGSGPPLVLLHGFGASLYTWRHLIPLLERDHDLIALDLPGFGGSDQPPGLSWDLYPRIVLALLDRLGVERASLVGHSLGGAVAVSIAAARPERVRGLVLIDAAGYNLAAKDRPWLLRLSRAVPAPVLERLPRRALVRSALGQVFHDDSKMTDEDVEEYLAPLCRPGAMASIRSLMDPRNDAAAGRVAEAIAAVRQPTLVIWGRHDTWAPVAQGERLAEAIPGSRLVLFEDCGHMPHEESPEEVATLVGGFLEQVENGAILGGPR